MNTGAALKVGLSDVKHAANYCQPQNTERQSSRRGTERMVKRMALNPINDPLKGNAIIPQKYIVVLERRGWVKPIRCRECKYADEGVVFGKYCDLHTVWDGAEVESLFTVHDDYFCADGERWMGDQSGE